MGPAGDLRPKECPHLLTNLALSLTLHLSCVSLYFRSICVSAFFRFTLAPPFSMLQWLKARRPALCHVFRASVCFTFLSFNTFYCSAHVERFFARYLSNPVSAARVCMCVCLYVWAVFLLCPKPWSGFSAAGSKQRLSNNTRSVCLRPLEPSFMGINHSLC